MMPENIFWELEITSMYGNKMYQLNGLIQIVLPFQVQFFGMCTISRLDLLLKFFLAVPTFIPRRILKIDCYNMYKLQVVWKSSRVSIGLMFCSAYHLKNMALGKYPTRFHVKVRKTSRTDD